MGIEKDTRADRGRELKGLDEEKDRGWLSGNKLSWTGDGGLLGRGHKSLARLVFAIAPIHDKIGHRRR